MTIDWFTFTAQILNFLILAWLMKRFLYGPIIDAMDQRESMIATRLSDAETAEHAATERQREYQAKLDDLASTREELLSAAGREVETWRDDHTQKAKADVEGARRQWQQSLAREKQALLREMQLNVATHATNLSRHVLQELASERLQSLMVRRFVALLAESDPASLSVRNELANDLAALVESSHELSQSDRDTICEALAHSASTTIPVKFRINPQLICGIELRSAGSKLAWSIRDLLTEVESDLIDSIDEFVPGEATAPRAHDEVAS